MGIQQISNRALAELQHGRTRDDIYKRLSKDFPSDTGKIAYCLASIPDPELRHRYLKHNAVLFILLLLHTILTVAAEMPIDFSKPTLFLTINALIPLILAYFVFRFHGGIYRLTGIWCLIGLLETLLLKGAPDGIAALNLFSMFFAVVLSFTIARKVFPRLGVIGPRRGPEGNYLY